MYQLLTGSVADTGENDEESFGAIRIGGFRHQVSDNQLIKKKLVSVALVTYEHVAFLFVCLFIGIMKDSDNETSRSLVFRKTFVSGCVCLCVSVLRAVP